MSAADAAVSPGAGVPRETALWPQRAPALWLFEREVLRFLNIWRYSILGPVLSTVLFVVVFGSALGRRVASVDGTAYGRFIVPGLLAQAIVNVGFFNGTTSLFEARRDQYINGLFASPLRWWEINLALVGGGVTRGVFVGTGVLATALPLAGGRVVRPLVLLLGTPAVLLIAAQLGVIAGSLAKSLDHVYAMESIVLLPLGFLGGVFYSVRQLPPVWDALSRFDPVFWLVQVERIGFLGHGDVAAGWALLVVWALAAALSAWSAAIFGTERLKP